MSLMIRQAAYICKSAERIVEPTSDALTPVAMMPLLPAPDAVAGVINGTAGRAAQPAASPACALLPLGRIDFSARRFCTVLPDCYDAYWFRPVPMHTKGALRLTA